MTEYRLISDPRADLDVEAAFEWYENEQPRLGFEFLNELRPECDLRELLKGGIQGKHAIQYEKGTNLVLLDHDVAEAFPTHEEPSTRPAFGDAAHKVAKRHLMKGQSRKPNSSDDDERILAAKSLLRPRVGSVEWERAGGPPLSYGQRLRVLGGAAAVVLGDLGPRLWWVLSQWGLLPSPRPEKVDLTAWTPPDTRAASEAQQYLREVSSVPMVNHSLRTYYFSGILYALSGVKQSIDHEALYVAALLHDVGLFQISPPPTEHCFTVGGAREARRIAKGAGWDDARQDRMAVAITTNLNAFVSMDEFGLEAHFMRVGGLVEVIAQEWKVHPENLAEILDQYPRDGFTAEALRLVQQEVKQNPGGRFACLNPLFPMLVRRSAFSQESLRRGLTT